MIYFDYLFALFMSYSVHSVSLFGGVLYQESLSMYAPEKFEIPRFQQMKL